MDVKTYCLECNPGTWHGSVCHEFCWILNRKKDRWNHSLDVGGKVYQSYSQWHCLSHQIVPRNFSPNSPTIKKKLGNLKELYLFFQLFDFKIKFNYIISFYCRYLGSMI